MKVGELAENTDVVIQTLSHCERTGLLLSPLRSGSRGSRVYGEGNPGQARFIRLAMETLRKEQIELRKSFKEGSGGGWTQ